MFFLYITRGLPGSGKTTWAKGRRLPRANRDTFRELVSSEPWDFSNRAAEDLVTVAQFATIRAWLPYTDVAVDDTNLDQAHVALLEGLCTPGFSTPVIVDFTNVPVETCIARDALRPQPVGEAVIRAMAAKYLGGGCG